MTLKISEEKSKRGRKAGAILFPRDPLKRILPISDAIWKQNAGNPFNILDLAPAVSQSPTSSTFIRQLASSYRYGLTEGSPTTKVISLTSLGRSIVAPTVDTDVNASLRRALTYSTIFQKVYQFFDGKPIPRQDILRNTLTNPSETGGFDIPREDVDEFMKTWMQNITDYSLAQDIKGTAYLRLDKLSAGEVAKQITEFGTEEEEKRKIEEIIKEEKVTEKPKIEEEKIVEKPRVFISHSKNKKIVEQIKQILDFGQFEYRIAEERETTAIPIPDKVFGLMRECNCAIINVSADEQEKRKDETYGINQNVLMEIGAAFLRYNKKVILLVDKRIELPSNLQGLYRCDYEGDELTFSTAMKLQKTLTEFRK